MKNKTMIWLSLVCGIILACSPVLAQGPQNGAPAPPPNGERLGPPPGQQPGSHPGSPLPSLPPMSPLDPDQRDAQRTIPGAYRLTYTLTEMDGSKKVGVHRYSIVLDAGHNVPPSQLRLGSKVPLETGELQGNSTSQSISYVDVGLNIEASLRSFANGLELRSQVTQSAVDPQQSLTKDPVIRATDFRSTVLLTEDKPLIIGTVDMPGTTHVLQIQVELTKIP
jgi:hypothetical protein